MKATKKIISFVLVAIMLASALPAGIISAGAETATVQNADDVFYDIDFNGISAGSLDTNLKGLVPSDKNPYGFSLGDSGGLKGEIIDAG